MRALITGIGGQDGAYLARWLLDCGYEVFGTSRSSATTCPANLNRLGIDSRVAMRPLSMLDPDAVTRMIDELVPDEIYSLAGQSSVGQSFRDPIGTWQSIVDASLNLLEAIRTTSAPSRLFVAGSGECFGDTGGSPADERTPFHPLSPYAAAKAAAYWAVSAYRDAYGLFACTGLLFNHESPLRPDHFVTRKIVTGACRIALGSQETLQLGNLDITRDWGWAPEYVEAMPLMLRQPEAEDLILATGRHYTLGEFVDRVFSELGLDWREHVQLAPELARPTDPLVVAANPSKARESLGWAARTTMPELARKLVQTEWQRHHPGRPLP